MSKDTDTLDKLYLEWSQFTKAKTEREVILTEALSQIQEYANKYISDKDCLYINEKINRAFFRGALK